MKEYEIRYILNGEIGARQIFSDQPLSSVIKAFENNGYTILMIRQTGQ